MGAKVGTLLLTAASFGFVVLAGCASTSRASAPPSLPTAADRTSKASTGVTDTGQPAEKDKQEEPAERGEKGEKTAPAETAAATGREDGGAAQTPDEQKKALDGRLGASLSAFDAMLLKEQQAAAANRAAAEAQGSEEGSGGGNGDREGSSGAARAGGGARGTSASGRTGEPAGAPRGPGMGGSEGREQPSGSTRGGTTSRRGGRPSGAPGGGADVDSNDGGGEPPPDVGDGRDDDVVARQLREAAMSEKDPAIREKLWDEYRRYKGNKNAGKQ